MGLSFFLSCRVSFYLGLKALKSKLTAVLSSFFNFQLSFSFVQKSSKINKTDENCSFQIKNPSIHQCTVETPTGLIDCSKQHTHTFRELLL